MMAVTPLASMEADGKLGRTPGGIPIRIGFQPPPRCIAAGDMTGPELRLEHARLRLLRGFEDLLCLDGLRGVEHLPHQVDTVRRVLRQFRGRVLLADEVGLGKTIEACLLLREYLLRGLVRRVLILVPPSLVAQWRGELDEKFGLTFTVPGPSSGTHCWDSADRVLASMALAKSRKHFDAVAARSWDLVIVDESHHCKNRSTRNWQIVNALKRRHLFLLTATPVQNNLLELYSLLTLLEPGHLKTEQDFKRQYMTRGNPRDPRNRHRLRSLLADVMVRNTRSLVNINLPPRYAQTLIAQPGDAEAGLYRDLEQWLRSRCPNPLPLTPGAVEGESVQEPAESASQGPSRDSLSRMQVSSLLLAAGSHPTALARALEKHAFTDSRAADLLTRARDIHRSAKEYRLLDLLRQNPRDKTLIFAGASATLSRLGDLLGGAGIGFSVFSGAQTAEEKEAAVAAFREGAPVLLCSESGGEGRNLQFCNTLVNFDLPWNPMRLEQRIGRIHRYGQKREVFIFNLCNAQTLEARILRLLHEKVRMFELVVGEIGSILGNLEGGEEFESLVLDLWIKASDGARLDEEFDRLGQSLLTAQEEYLGARRLDEALFGEDFQ